MFYTNLKEKIIKLCHLCIFWKATREVLCLFLMVSFLCSCHSAVWLIWIIWGLRILSFTGMPTIRGSYTLHYYGMQLQFYTYKSHKKSYVHTLTVLPLELKRNIYISSSQSLAVKDPLKYSNSFWCFAISGPSQLRWKKNQTQKQTQGHGFMNFPSQVCEITTVHTLCRTVWFQQNHPSSFILNVSDIKYPIQNRVLLFSQSTFSIITKKIL